MNIDFEIDGHPQSMHTCEGKREGDWIVFTCPHCPEYENRINFRTKERKGRPAADPDVLHNGTFVPTGLEQVEGNRSN